MSTTAIVLLCFVVGLLCLVGGIWIGLRVAEEPSPQAPKGFR